MFLSVQENRWEGVDCMARMSGAGDISVTLPGVWTSSWEFDQKGAKKPSKMIKGHQKRPAPRNRQDARETYASA
jgi:hypothetical protein